MGQSNERCESILFDIEAVATIIENGSNHALVHGIGGTIYTHYTVKTDFGGSGKEGTHGKLELSPEHQGVPVHFNLSRFHRVCVVSLSSMSPFGVDIELKPLLHPTGWFSKKQVFRANVVRRLYLPEKQELLSRLDTESEAHLHLWHNEFLRMWTAKEQW